MRASCLSILAFSILAFTIQTRVLSAEKKTETPITDTPAIQDQTLVLETAKALKLNKLYDCAIKMYFSLIEKGVSAEEAWIAKYSIGECYELKGSWENALYWYMEAYQLNPKRTIVLKKIAHYYRLHGENNNAYLFAKHGSIVTNQNTTSVSDIPPINSYDFDEEISISAFYTDYKNDGYTSVNKIILNKHAPWYVKNQGYRNLLYYIKHLNTSKIQPIECDLPPIVETSEERYHPMNPSIQITQDGYKVICRSVNYTQVGARVFNTIDPTGYFRTRNFLLYYDKDFNLLSQHEILDNLPRKKFRSLLIQGFEDCRIFQMGNSSWFTCTTTDTSPLVSHQISLCKLSDEKSDLGIEVEKLLPLIGPDPYRIEKNWLPFILNNSLHFVYSYDPFMILQPDLETGSTKLLLEYHPPLDFSNFRGSAAPIQFENGYLMLVHEVVYHAEGERTYTHRFVYLNNQFQIEKLTEPFVFIHLGIEFCCSMTLNHEKTQIILPIGIEDNQAFLCFLNIETLKSSLKPLENFQ